MTKHWALVFLLCLTLAPDSWSNPPDKDDTGTPLFLTPYIENGLIEEAKNLSKVRLTEELNITSYSGYFTVNKTYNANHFLWYFPVLSGNKDAPLFIYLNGGPGSSGVGGLFNQIGPLQVKNGRLETRQYHWTLNYHVIFVDNPVGTGFSFTDDARAYCTNDGEVADQLYNTLLQFFELFPDLRSNHFFIMGLSYAGKFAPALAYTIHTKNPTAKIRINLKGIAIGNGLIDPVSQVTVYDSYLYQLGLVDWNGAAEIKKIQDHIVKCINNSLWIQATDALNYLMYGFKINETLLTRLTGFTFYMNMLFDWNYMSDEYKEYIEKTSVRKEIHVGNVPFSNGFWVKAYLREDITKSVAPLLATILDYYHVLLYNGQLDIMLPYQSILKFLQQFKFSGADFYKTAKRYIYKVDGEVAAYVRRAGQLVEVLVRNAGHIVPVDQPRIAYEIITTFVNESTQESIMPLFG